MEQGKTNIPKFLLMIIVYTVLAILGFFSRLEAVLFPVFALPVALYVVNEKPQLVLQAVFHTVILGINFVVSDYNVVTLLIYIVSVIIPAMIIAFVFEQKVALPNFIMYVAVALCILIFAYFSVLKLFGIDFEQIYIDCINEFQKYIGNFTQEVISIAKANKTATADEIDTWLQAEKIYVAALEMMKAFYAYLVITISISVSALIVLIYNAILRKKYKELPSIKQLLEFRLSKMAVVIFVIAMVVVSSITTDQSAVKIFGLNLMRVFIWLFRLAGGLGLIGLISRSTVKNGLKIVGYVGVILAFSIFPYVLMIFGCLDTFFNYRKIDIVV